MLKTVAPVGGHRLTWTGRKLRPVQYSSRHELQLVGDPRCSVLWCRLRGQEHCGVERGFKAGGCALEWPLRAAHCLEVGATPHAGGVRGHKPGNVDTQPARLGCQRHPLEALTCRAACPLPHCGGAAAFGPHHDNALQQHVVGPSLPPVWGMERGSMPHLCYGLEHQIL